MRELEWNVVSLKERETSAEIVESCRRGDRDAFRALYESHKERVYSICYYFFHADAAAAGDATQQVFLKLFTQIPKYRGDSDFATWLYRLVVNTCIDSARRDRPRGKPVSEQAMESLATAATHEDDIAREETAASVRTAVASLPPKLRLPVLLRYFDELSYQELSASLGVSMGSVASRLSRAHKLLAEKLSRLRNQNV